MVQAVSNLKNTPTRWAHKGGEEGHPNHDWISRGRELLLSLAKETNNRKGRLIEALEHSVQKHSQRPNEENTYKGGPKYQLSCK